MPIQSILMVIPSALLAIPTPILILPFDPCRSQQFPSKVMPNDSIKERSMKLLVQSTESIEMEIDCGSTTTLLTER